MGGTNNLWQNWQPVGTYLNHEVYMPTFGELLRRLRGNRSQREVATDLQMPVTTLSTLENQESIPRGPVLKKFADYYAVPLAYFYTSSSAEIKPTSAASAWLHTLRQGADVPRAKETIATYSSNDFSEDLKHKIADKIAKKLSEKKRANKTSHSHKT
jgi:transcriptional regulator with XRE-family HTH domain